MYRLLALLWLMVLAFCPGARAAGVAETWQERPGLQQIFAEAGLTGTIVVLDGESGIWYSADSRRAFTPYLPASTFKIPNTLIALETGVAKNENEPYAWDHKQRGMTGWNSDQTLSTAFERSTVWVYQRIARQIGEARMQQYLYDFRYGNAQIAPAIDRFWLDGALRITAVEQIEFLRRFNEGRLPLSAHTVDVARKVMQREQHEHYRIFWKTGLTGADAPQPNIGWFVGWVERGSERIYFALNADIPSPTLLSAREAITRKVLASMGYLG